MTRSRPWPAPAKLNLFLHIIGRREDGYHDLQTAFQFVSQGDSLVFESLPGGKIHRLNPVASIPEDQDLVVRAAKLLQQELGLTAEGVGIALEKRLPMGGGLGGGSSDAATTLVALNRLWGGALTEDDLAELGLSLGADVPVFIRGRAAWAEGIGERLSPLEGLEEPWYAIVHPGVSVATGEIFNHQKLTRNCSPIKIEDFLSGVGGNVFEPVVRMEYPEIDRAFLALDNYNPRLTGSGACLFACFASQEEAMAVSPLLDPKWHCFVARGCNLSPLKRRVEEESAD